jgi:hypothetical protein
MKREICELLKGGSLGFNELLGRLQAFREERGERRGSSETLSSELKTLQEQDVVKRDLRSRMYKLTQLGGVLAKGTGGLSVKPVPLDSLQRFLRRLEDAQSDFVQFLIESYVLTLQTAGKKRVTLPKSFVDQVLGEVESFMDGKKLGIRQLWGDLVNEFAIDLSTFLTALILIQVSQSRIVAKRNLAAMIHKSTSLWAEFRARNIQEIIANYLSNPEVLTAIDQAMRKHSFKHNLALTEFKLVEHTLRQQEFLKAPVFLARSGTIS